MKSNLPSERDIYMPKNISVQEKIRYILKKHQQHGVRYAVDDLKQLIEEVCAEKVQDLKRFILDQGSKLEPFDIESLVRKYQVSSDDIEEIYYYGQKRLVFAIAKGLDDYLDQLQQSLDVRENDINPNKQDIDVRESLDSFESLDSQVDRLANFILENIPGEPSQSEGAIDCAIRLLKKRYTKDKNK